MGLISRWKTRIGQAMASLATLSEQVAALTEKVDVLERRSVAAADHLTDLTQCSAAVAGKFQAVMDRLLPIEARAAEAVGYGQTNHYLQTDFGERSLLLQGRMAANAIPDQLHSLADAEFRVFSQWGEDGIIDWLVRTVPVPNTRFVEFGVENFREANCRFLLQNRNWRGLVMDGSQAHMEGLKNDRMYWMFDLTAKPAFITAENINALIASAGFDGPLGILSIDIDGNDYWVWEAIEGVDAAIIICEYNPILGDTQPIALPYKADFNRFDGHHSGLYFGCSIAALTSLAKRKGYTLVGTNSNGINAFFVRNDLAGHVLDKLGEVVTHPSRHRDSRDEQGQLCFTGGLDRYSQMHDLPVINVETKKTVLLREIEKPYSDDWLKRML